MSNAKSSKGNPAHKRMSNPNNAVKRARSWKRGQERKERNRLNQKTREQANRVLVADGKLPPHAELNQHNAQRVKASGRPEVHQPIHSLEFEPKKRVWIVKRIVEGQEAVMRRFKEWEEARLFLDIANSWL